jgi:hypothetical protein
MKTIENQTTSQLITLSDRDLSATTGGGAPGCSPHIFTQAEADQRKRELDRYFGFDLKDPGRAVARTVPGHPGQFTVETPRLDGHGTRRTI